MASRVDPSEWRSQVLGPRRASRPGDSKAMPSFVFASLVRVWSARGPRTGEKRRKPLRIDEHRKLKQGKGCRRLALVRLGCPKTADKPSHGRGHWFEPSSAHTVKRLC